MSPISIKAGRKDLGSIRLVASDLDGTLIVGQFNAGNLTPRTIKVLHALEKKGIRIVFASGRPVRTMLKAVEQAQLNNLMVICCNGAQILDSHSKKIIKKFSIPPEHVSEIIGKVKDAFGDEAYIGIESDVNFKCEAGYAEKRRASMYHPHIIVDDPRTGFMLNEQDTVEKIIIVHKTWPADKLHTYLKQHVFNDPKWDDIIHPTYSSQHFVEISAANVSKATALKYLCEQLDITQKQVIAFGDMPNDIEMIKFAGIGVAMGNAHKEVKKLADLVTARNVDDGVAIVLERMLRKL